MGRNSPRGETGTPVHEDNGSAGAPAGGTWWGEGGRRGTGPPGARPALLPPSPVVSRLQGGGLRGGSPKVGVSKDRAPLLSPGGQWGKGGGQERVSLPARGLQDLGRWGEVSSLCPPRPMGGPGAEVAGAGGVEGRGDGAGWGEGADRGPGTEVGAGCPVPLAWARGGSSVPRPRRSPTCGSLAVADAGGGGGESHPHEALCRDQACMGRLGRDPSGPPCRATALASVPTSCPAPGPGPAGRSRRPTPAPTARPTPSAPPSDELTRFDSGRGRCLAGRRGRCPAFALSAR